MNEFAAKDAPVKAPEWLAALLDTQPRPAPAESALAGEPVTPAVLTDMLKRLDPSCDYEEWRDIAAGIHAAPLSDPDFDKQDLFVQWSRGDFGTAGTPANFTSEEDCEFVYDTMPPKKGGIAFGSLVKRCRDAGYSGPVGITGREAFKDTASQLQDSSRTTPEQVPDDDAPRAFDDVLKAPAKDVQELVSGWIERGIPTFLAGAGGSNKSRLALQIGLSVSAGMRVLGQKVEQAHFVFLSSEDHADEVTRRAQAIAKRLKIEPPLSAHFWDRQGKNSVLAVMSEGGDAELQPFYDRLVAYLKGITGHKFVVLDSCYDFVAFAGKAKLDEGAVNAFVKRILQSICDETDATLLIIWHPSQAGQERGDASGWSVAWHNAPRARLSITAQKDVPDAFDFKVEKRNHGAKGLPVTLYWSEGALLPRDNFEVAEAETRFLKAVMHVVRLSAERGTPIQKQRRLEGWQLEEIESRAGFRPTDRQVKEALGSSLRVGRLRYKSNTRHHAAGYYPWDSADEIGGAS
jgi:hypothetical protein